MSPALRAEEQTDEALMIRAQADDTDAFAQLYDRHAERAFRVARAICRDSGRAEDAVQEGFLSIWRNRASYQLGVGSFQAWSMRIIRNRAIDSFRAAAVRPPAQIDNGNGDRPQAGDTDSPQDRVVTHSERKTLLASVRELPKAQAEVIVLAFYGDLSHSEIAAQLDLPTGTVKGRMRLGLEKLRTEMNHGAA